MTKEQIVFVLGLAWITLLFMNISQATPQKSSDHYVAIGTTQTTTGKGTAWFIDVNKNKMISCGSDGCSSVAIP